MKLNLLAVVADTHCGSVYGLVPPSFQLGDGGIYEQNAIQQWAWKCWKDSEDFIWDVAGKSPYALVVNGDAIEGNHHRTTEIISPAIDDHFNCADVVLGPLAKRAARRFVVRGTECHVGNSESGLGNKMGAECAPGSKRAAFDRLPLNVNGCRVVFRHHVATTARPYLESGAFSIALACEREEAVRNGEAPPQVVCCAHRHKFGLWEDESSLMIVSPPFQAGLTRHGNKVVPHARCRVGVYLLDWRGKPEGSLPDVHKRIYATPPEKFIEV